MLWVDSGEGTGCLGVVNTAINTRWMAHDPGTISLRTEPLSSSHSFHALLEQALLLVVSVAYAIRQEFLSFYE